MPDSLISSNNTKKTLDVTDIISIAPNALLKDD